jgi:hypothetical protein
MASSKIKIIEVQEKGGFKIPKTVLEQLPFKPMGKFLILQGKDYVMFKKVNEPPLSERFEKLAEAVQRKFKEAGIKKSDIAKAIKWARKK